MAFFNVKDLVAAWTAGTYTNYGIAFKCTTLTECSRDFWSREHTADTTLRPKLVVDYSTVTGKTVTTNITAAPVIKKAGSTIKTCAVSALDTIKKAGSKFLSEAISVQSSLLKSCGKSVLSTLTIADVLRKSPMKPLTANITALDISIKNIGKVSGSQSTVAYAAPKNIQKALIEQVTNVTLTIKQGVKAFVSEITNLTTLQKDSRVEKTAGVGILTGKIMIIDKFFAAGITTVQSILKDSGKTKIMGVTTSSAKILAGFKSLDQGATAGNSISDISLLYLVLSMGAGISSGIQRSIDKLGNLVVMLTDAVFKDMIKIAISRVNASMNKLVMVGKALTVGITAGSEILYTKMLYLVLSMSINILSVIKKDTTKIGSFTIQESSILSKDARKTLGLSATTTINRVMEGLKTSTATIAAGSNLSYTKMIYRILSMGAGILSGIQKTVGIRFQLGITEAISGLKSIDKTGQEQVSSASSALKSVRKSGVMGVGLLMEGVRTCNKRLNSGIFIETSIIKDVMKRLTENICGLAVLITQLIGGSTTYLKTLVYGVSAGISVNKVLHILTDSSVALAISIQKAINKTFLHNITAGISITLFSPITHAVYSFKSKVKSAFKAKGKGTDFEVKK